MLHLTMNMPFILMTFYGSLMILAVLLFRGLLKSALPKFVFPVLWCVILVRLLVPFSLSSPLTLKTSGGSPLSALSRFTYALTENIAVSAVEESTYNSVVVQDALAAGSAAIDFNNIDIEINGTDTHNLNSSITSNKDIDQTRNINGKDTSLIRNTAIHNTDNYQATVETLAEDNLTIAYGTGAEYAGNTFWRLSPARIPWKALYFGGLLLTATILLAQKYRYSSRLKNRLLIEHNETINTLLREMDMGHVLVFTNDEIASPLVCGLFAPRIYLPARMDFQDTGLLRHIFTHETMHIKRKDNWVKAFMLAALCVNWFNPLVWAMSKCLASDLEAACDEAVLGQYADEEQRKSYASSLLAIAVTGNRPALLYSAFSKTEVEKRIRAILRYKKASALLLTAAVAFLLGSTVAFATGVQAPFSSRLSAYCASAHSRWGVSAEITRDIALGQDPQKRADNTIFNVLEENGAEDPEVIKALTAEALAKEFHVEKSAFNVTASLCLSEEEMKKEYEEWGLTQDEQGFFLYQGEPVRIFRDETGRRFLSREEGVCDITVRRDRRGYIADVITRPAGEQESDQRTSVMERW